MELCNWEVSGLCQHGWSDTAPTVYHRLSCIHGYSFSYNPPFNRFYLLLWWFFTDFLFWAVGIRKTINQCLLKESYFKKFFVQPFSTFHWLSLNPMTSYWFGVTFLKSFVSSFLGGQKILWRASLYGSQKLDCVAFSFFTFKCHWQPQITPFHLPSFPESDRQ